MAENLPINDRLKRTILKALDLEGHDIRENTRADEVPGWDSLNHVRVILAVEKEFNVRLKGVEILRLKSVGELQKLVDLKSGTGGS